MDISSDNDSAVRQLINSPEMQSIRQMMRESALRQAAEDQAWWDSLTMDERAQAFRQVVKLIYKAELVDKGSYRHIMYDIFDIDYTDGLDCYMELHNVIFKGMEAN